MIIITQFKYFIILRYRIYIDQTELNYY